jgi:hypothetical protein
MSPESVSTSVYLLRTVGDAVRWFAASRRFPGGWQVKPCEIGDAGRLAQHTSGQFNVSFRRRGLVGTVGGRDRRRVIRFADRVVAYLDGL